MNNAFKKYLLLLNILLLSGLANLYANSIIDYTPFTQEKNNFEGSISLQTQTDYRVLDLSSENNRGKKTYKEFIDSETFEENNEDKLDIDFKSLSYGSHLATIFYAQLLDSLNCELQETKQRYIFNYSKISLRLHAKFQVFII
ncbi:hypothetical protein [Algibacter pacificus]|uniref:hypothetical protein n=1 Tax=Algibacter pacificus TaxID=2599389 RepID=UPI0011C9467F|nr:hypothetical protein [Algibacter pacificus]